MKGKQTEKMKNVQRNECTKQAQRKEGNRKRFLFFCAKNSLSLSTANAIEPFGIEQN